MGKGPAKSAEAHDALAATDWKAIDAMTDCDIAQQILENPDAGSDLSDAPPGALRVIHPAGSVGVRAIRAKLDLTQEEFAARYGFSKGAVRDWEQGRKQPDLPTRVLLLLIERDPELVASTVRAAAA